MAVDAPVVGWALALYEARLLHPVDHACPPARAEQDPAGELVHPQSVLCLIKVDEGVVRAQRDLPLRRAIGRRFDASVMSA